MCLGTTTVGGRTEEADARRVVDSAADVGVDFIDTADTCADGRSEPIVGRAIAEPRTMEQRQGYLGALEARLEEEDERFVGGLVPAGTTAVHQLVDPRYPVEGRPQR